MEQALHRIEARGLSVDYLVQRHGSRSITEYIVTYGVPLVWSIEPDSLTLGEYRAGRSPVVFDGEHTLKGYEVIPGFSCKVSDLFTLPGQPPPAATL